MHTYIIAPCSERGSAYRKACSGLKNIYASKAPSKAGFVPRTVHVEFVVHKVVLEQNFLQGLRFFPVSVIRSMLHTRGAQIPGARSPWKINFVWWLLIFVGPQKELLYHNYRAHNSEVAPTFLENLCTYAPYLQFTHVQSTLYSLSS